MRASADGGRAIHGKGKCWICDGDGHLAADCWYKDEAKKGDARKGCVKKKLGGGKGKQAR